MIWVVLVRNVLQASQGIMLTTALPAVLLPVDDQRHDYLGNPSSECSAGISRYDVDHSPLCSPLSCRWSMPWWSGQSLFTTFCKHLSISPALLQVPFDVCCAYYVFYVDWRFVHAYQLITSCMHILIFFYFLCLGWQQYENGSYLNRDISRNWFSMQLCFSWGIDMLQWSQRPNGKTPALREGDLCIAPCFSKSSHNGDLKK